MTKAIPSHKEVTIADFTNQLVSQGYDKEAAAEEANRLYVATYGESAPAPAPVSRKAKAAE
jgi:hypothetical protein